MKKISREEFEERSMAVMRARRIYMKSGVTNNLSHAWEIYQEVLGSMDRLARITTAMGHVHGKHSPLDTFKRPLCPECDNGTELFLRRVTTPKGPANIHGWQSAWECKQCAHEEYSTDDLMQATKKLELRDATA